MWRGEVQQSVQEGGYIVALRAVEPFTDSGEAEAAKDAALARLNAPSPAAPGESQTGKVKWYNATKGFGFIVPDDGGRDVFCHASVVREAGIADLVPDQAVTFSVVQGPKGPAVVSIAA